MHAIKKLRAGLTFANVTALSALVFAMAGSAYALSMPHPDGVLHGCVSNRTQASRVVGSSAPCHRVKRRHGRVIDRGEFPIAWSQQGPRGPQGPTGAAGPAGRTGPTGTVDTSQFDTRAAADQRYERTTRITYGSADSSANGQLVVAWPQLGFEVTTAGPASLGNIAERPIGPARRADECAGRATRRRLSATISGRDETRQALPGRRPTRDRERATGEKLSILLALSRPG
ncbi:MAG: hypothetical protein WBP81_27360 [Solirubrobacteraceae bacterium]